MEAGLVQHGSLHSSWHLGMDCVAAFELPFRNVAAELMPKYGGRRSQLSHMRWCYRRAAREKPTVLVRRRRPIETVSE